VKCGLYISGSIIEASRFAIAGKHKGRDKADFSIRKSDVGGEVRGSFTISKQ
jgi:hypothetical protein